MRRLWRASLRLFFRLLYNQCAWVYDLVAWVVSLGQWNAWGRTAIP
ncbi:MAG: class I SAM-dependent methyltransferase, partial [Anaerolineae bacterium]|nr:class I SAM-dependent methyltransferase [Anaerolineae bacterium]